MMALAIHLLMPIRSIQRAKFGYTCNHGQEVERNAEFIYRYRFYVHTVRTVAEAWLLPLNDA
jgi:hypothetical protein